MINASEGDTQEGGCIVAKRQFERVAGWTAVAAGLCAVGTSVLLAMVPGADSGDLGALLYGGSTGLLRWSMLLDLLGFYLLPAPLALLLWARYRSDELGMAELATLSGIAYMLIGAIGATVLAAVAPGLSAAYASADAPQQASIALVSSALVDGVVGGIWNILEMPLAGIWWLWLGLALWPERRVLGATTLTLGACSFIDGVLTALGLDTIATPFLSAYLFLMPVWALWWGILLLRGDARQRPVTLAGVRREV
jgi:hypothetical protein